MLALGSIRSMKRTQHNPECIRDSKENYAGLTSRYPPASSKARTAILSTSIYSLPATRTRSISWGLVSREQKIELMQRAHVLAVTSIKEGWGLVVTEAASQGTPAVVYGVDGLRDSVRDGETGIITAGNTPQALAQSIERLLSDAALYEKLRENAWQWSKEITFDKSYQQFLEIITEWNHPRMNQPLVSAIVADEELKRIPRSLPAVDQGSGIYEHRAHRRRQLQRRRHPGDRPQVCRQGIRQGARAHCAAQLRCAQCGRGIHSSSLIVTWCSQRGSSGHASCGVTRTSR